MAPARIPSPEEVERRKIVGINPETITNITSNDFPYHWTGEDHAWDLEVFRSSFRVAIHHISPAETSFSLIGIDASIANALRRILIAEIPTLAVENVWITQNTSVIQDEVLAHRLGLIPFKGGKEGLLNWMKWYPKPAPGEDQMQGMFDYNTVRLTLNVKCEHRNPKDIPAGATDPRAIYKHAHVYAKDIVFEPVGRQTEFFAGENAIAPVHPDILIAKMRPGQSIDLEMHMHKGVGSDHAKFSPVATASYRLLPIIEIKRPILGADAKKFKKCFPEGVIGIEKVTREDAAKAGSGYEDHVDEKKAVVVDPMRDTMSRECLRHPEFADKVKLGRKRDHFIFNIESTGQWDSDALFMEAIKTFREKCVRLEQQVVDMTR